MDGAACVPWKTGQKERQFHDPYTDPDKYPQRAVRGQVKKSSRHPSWTELHACHGKQGKSTYDSTIRTRTSTRTQNGPYVDTGKKVPDARRGRSCTCVMENRAKTQTIPRSVHGRVHVPTTCTRCPGKTAHNPWKLRLD